MTPPGCTCATCQRPMRELARRTDAGWTHPDACPTACACGAALSASNRIGICRNCYDRERKRRMRQAARHFCTDCGAAIGKGTRRDLCRRCYDRHRRAGTLTPARPLVAALSVYQCPRCGITTTAKYGVCKDCRDVLSEDEIGRWVA